MSKIQKAIGDIQKQQAKAAKSDPMLPIGQVVSERDTAETHRSHGGKMEIGYDTRQLAGLDPSKVRRRIEIDRGALRLAGFFAPEDEEREIVDQFRQIKRPLVAHAFGKRATKIHDGHLILVSSALAGDGKTFTCLNLALSIAREQDRSVLLVDADVAKAHITRLFGAEKQPGLLDVLEDSENLNLQDTILETDVKGMSLMTAGSMRTHSTELLASERMESLIKVLSAEDPNRIVLFDSSPLLATSESRVLTSLVGQIVMVVSAQETPQQAVLDAIETIDESKAVNLILNRARHSNGGGYYGYGPYGGGRNDSE